MTLSALQQDFMLALSDLLIFIHRNGYNCTLGDGYRDPKIHGAPGAKIVCPECPDFRPYGRAWSNHKLRLAIDINLFKDGVYLTKTEDHRLTGEYWETLHPQASWGGRFDDGNHYSFLYRGRR